MLRVIAVDDDELNALGYAAAFATEDFEYLGCLGFEEALAREDWSGIDRVLLDLGWDQTPGHDDFIGAEVAERIRLRQDPDNPPRIVIVTRWTELPRLRARVDEVGIDAWYRREKIVTLADVRELAINADLEIPYVPTADIRGQLVVKPGKTLNEVARTMSDAMDDLGLTKSDLSRGPDGTAARKSKARKVEGFRYRIGTVMDRKNIDRRAEGEARSDEPPSVPQILHAGDIMFAPEFCVDDDD